MASRQLIAVVRLRVVLIALAGGLGGMEVGQAAGPSEIELAVLELARSGRVEEGVRKATEGLEAEGDMGVKSRLYVMRGDMYLSMMKLEEAAKDMDAGVAADPKNGLAYYRKGAVLKMKREGMDDALEAFGRSGELGFAHPDMLSDAGFIYRIKSEDAVDPAIKREMFLKSMESYREALRLDPKHARSLGNAGDMTFNLGDYERAEFFYKRLQEIMPANPQVLSKLAHTLTRLRRFEEALRWLDEADAILSKTPAPRETAMKSVWYQTRAELQSFRVEALMGLDRKGEARVILERAVAGDGAGPEGFTVAYVEEWKKKAKEMLEGMGK